MYLSRRHFLQITGGTAALAAVGAGLLAGGGSLAGTVEFADRRALPGMMLGLRVDVESPGETTVSIVAESDGERRVIREMRGDAYMRVEVPCIETRAESFLLYAVVEDSARRTARSAAVEVLSRPFVFGI